MQFALHSLILIGRQLCHQVSLLFLLMDKKRERGAASFLPNMEKRLEMNQFIKGRERDNDLFYKSKKTWKTHKSPKRQSNL
jgi:hypothetical protein